MSEEIYVVVAENDQPHRGCYDPHGPLVFEQYTRSADLESIKMRRDQLQQSYGHCRIAKLEFIDG